MAKPIKPEYVALGERIKAARVRAGRSQEDVTMITGISKQAISAWERGQAPPTLDNLAKFAKAVDATVEALLSGTAEEITRGSSVSRRLDAGASFVPLYGFRVWAEVIMGKINQDSLKPDRFIATSKRHSDRAIAIQIKDRSMEPRFQPGDSVTIEPDLDPEPGNLVYAWANGEPLFRRWFPVKHGEVEASKLQANNSAFPEVVLGSGDLILGVMREHTSFHHD